LDTGSYLGRIVKRIPFVIDNPSYGKPVAELRITAKLRAQYPRATVAEIYQGAALPRFGVPSYDGARDVYFGDGRGDKGFGGSCTNWGTDLSYGTDLRFQLHLGGEARRTLIKFDLAMLPKDARVAKALMMLHVEELNKKADLNYRVIALKKRWSETIVGLMGGLNATNVAKPPSRGPLYPVGQTENWEKPLCRGKSDRHPEPITWLRLKTTGWAAVDITPAARNWVSGTWANHGVAIEPVSEKIDYGRHDVRITASDHPVDPRLRPRLILVLEGNIEAVAHRVRERNTNLKAALAKAKAAGKPVLCHVLAASSLTSRRFESQVLNSVAAVKRYIDQHFVEVRIDGEMPGHRPFLKAWGVRRLPTAVILTPEGKRIGILEPFDWDAPSGLVRSAFEFEQIYTRELARALRNRVPSRGSR